MRTNLFKRTLTLFLMLVMLLSAASVTAAAVDDPLLPAADWTGGKLTVTLVVPNDKANLKVKIIKLIGVNTAATTESGYQPTDPEYYWVDKEIGKWVSGVNPAYVETYKQGTDEIYLPTKAFENPKDPKSAEFFDRLEAYLEGLPIDKKKTWIEKTGDDLVPCADGYQAVFEGLEMGMYLIAVNGDQSVYRPTVVKFDPKYNESMDTYVLDTMNAEVTMKGTPVTLTKVIVGGTETQKTTAAIDGEAISYKIETLIPTYPDNTVWTKNTYLLKDTMAGQDLLPNTVHVEIGNVDKTAELNIKVNGYTLAALQQEENAGLLHDAAKTEIVIDLNGRKNYDDFLKGNKKLVLTYQTKLNQTAKLISGNDNTATLTYANDPYISSNNPNATPMEKGEKTLEDAAQVFTYGIQVTKISAEEGKLLQGAEFSLTDKSGQPLTFTLNSDGIYEKDFDGKDTLRSNEEGKILIRGLDVGTYSLKETKAPLGYSKNPQTFPITIQDKFKTETDTSGNITIKSGLDGLPENTANTDATKYEYYDDCMVPQTVKDTHTFALPDTGGLGTVLYTVFGILLMAGGALLIVVFLRRRRD